MANAKQFEFQVTGRGVLTDPTLPLTAANLTFVADIVSLNGVSDAVAGLDSTSISAINNAMETIVTIFNKLQQTITFTTASVSDGETLTVTVDGITGTYANSSGSPVVQTAGALATAVKGALDATPAFFAKFDSVVSGTNLVLTQKAPYRKIGLAVVAGTGVTGADTITVA